MTRIILVCGGRDYANRQRVFDVLNELERTRGPIIGLVHGAARGADAIAAEWQNARIKVMGPHGRLWMAGYPADWTRHGKAAGPIRNKHMLDQHPGIRLVVAFPGGKGTANMIEQARERGIEVLEASPTKACERCESIFGYTDKRDYFCPAFGSKLTLVVCH